MGVSCGGGVHWKTDVTPVMGIFQRYSQSRGNVFQNLKVPFRLGCSGLRNPLQLQLCYRCFLVLFRVTHHRCHWASLPSLTRIHRPQCRTPSVDSQEKRRSHRFYVIMPSDYITWYISCLEGQNKSINLPVTTCHLATHPFIFFILAHVLNGVLEVFNCELHDNMEESWTN